MKCPKCQFDNAKDAKFCNECGSRLELGCPKCGRTNRAGSKFCNQCGHDLSKPFSPTEPEILQQSHTLSQTPEAAPLPEGERRQATILFSDLSGYTSMNERLDPEQVETFMRRIKKEAIRIVESHDGIVNQFVGDEVLALFGIPTAHEDDPIRAIKAALKLHKIVREVSPEVENRLGEPVRMHTGIHTGLIVTNLRDDRDGIFGITGDTVNIGARLKSHAETDEILISQRTQQLIGPYFETEVFREIKLKGKSKPMIPYRVIGESKIHSRFEASEKKGFTAYAGRIQELATLHSCLEKAVEGKGQFVTVAGEAGAGKSRLHYEFRHSLDRQNLTILQGRCQSYGSDTPYLPFLDALRRGLQLKDEDSPSELLEKVVANSKAIDPALEQYIPLYLHLLSIRSDYALPEHLQGRELRKAVEEAFATVITLNTRHQPMVLILEDWHWSDEASQAVLKHLIGVITSYPLIVVVTYRPYYSENWGYLSYHTPIVLKPLDAPHTERIIRSVIGADSLPDGLVQLIHDRTGGNPLFIEEVCYSLVEEGVVVIKNNQAALTKSLKNLVLPETVQAIIRTRLDRLDSNTKEALRLASVIGRVFSQRILERIYSARSALSDSLEALKAVEVIQQVRVLPEAEYTFRHVLAQTVAYETLLLKRRTELHGAIGEAIEELYSERLEEQASILAYHFARSDKHDKAVAFAFLAGDQAARLCANTDATKYYEQALETARGLPSSPQVQQWQIDATLKLSAVGITRQDIERDRANLEQAHTLAEGLRDESRLSKVLYWLGRIHYVLWNPEIAMDFARQSLEIADRLRDDVLAAPPVNLVGRVYYQLSDFPEATQFLERSVQQMRHIGDKVEEATASAVAGYVLGIMGEFDRAFSHANHSIQLAQEIQNSFAEANAYHLRGTIHDQRGEWIQAITDYEEALRIAETAEDLFRLYLVKSWKGRAHAISGNPARGRELLEESLALAERIGTKFWLPWQKTALSACLSMLGEVDSASTLCQEGIDLGKKAGDKYVIAFAHRTFGKILSHIDSSDPHEAERSILEAIRIQQEIEAKSELARSYVAYARLIVGKKEKAKAKEFLAKAVDMFQHMGMAWDLAQTDEIATKLQD
jgi:predicted ATPase/class 3 adenylate cyclase